MAKQAGDAFDVLDALEFDPALHGTEVSQAHRLVAAVMEVINVPVFDPDSGEPTEASAEVLRKHTGADPMQA